MTDQDIDELISLARETGFMRGINHAADLARSLGNIELAIAIRAEIFEADTIKLANAKVA